jgi:hypothetical protein
MRLHEGAKAMPMHPGDERSEAAWAPRPRREQVEGRVVDDEIEIGRRHHSSRSASAGSATGMQSFTGAGRSGRPAGFGGQGRGFVTEGAVGMAPGVEHATIGAGRERSVETGEITDALPCIDPHDQRHERILGQNARRRGQN